MSRPKGSKLSEEHKQKIGLGNKGKLKGPMSVERRKQHSEILKKIGPVGNALRISDETVRRREFEKLNPKTKYCEVCLRPEKDFSKKLCLDHNHDTGQYRGWLCHNCNSALGHAKDDVNILYALANYLLERNDVSVDN